MGEGSMRTRRGFVQASMGAGLLLGVQAALRAQDRPARTIKLALVGCGGRGCGSIAGALEVAPRLGVRAEVVALADYFRDRAVAAGQNWGVPEERCFGGADGYRRVMETDADAVMLVTAPLFRPLHLEAAVEAGKHAFIEKPVAVDPPGCRRVIAAGEKAKQKGLVVLSGTEMRHDWAYLRTHQAVAVEGALGKLYGGRVAFCIAHMFSREPINPQTPDDLIRTWQNWLCLSGDHIVEQHVHNIDIANWFCGRPPVSAAGFGGRARRGAGDMYDFFSIDYDYGDGVHIHSMCRQVNNCWNWVGHDFVYERGHTDGANGPAPREQPMPADLPQADASHLQEQIDLLYQILAAQPVDQARAVAESSATAVMGRIAAYTGQQVTWDEIMGDPNRKPELYNLTLSPTAEDFETGNVALPAENVVPQAGYW